MGLYVTLAVAYVALAGPGLYFFWKQRGMRQYYQLSVGILSLCCTGMVLLMGMSTRFTGPFFTYATIKDTDRMRFRKPHSSTCGLPIINRTP